MPIVSSVDYLDWNDALLHDDGIDAGILVDPYHLVVLLPAHQVAGASPLFSFPTFLPDQLYPQFQHFVELKHQLQTGGQVWKEWQSLAADILSDLSLIAEIEPPTTLLVMLAQVVLLQKTLCVEEYLVRALHLTLADLLTAVESGNS